MYDHNTQRPRGFGVIVYDSEEAVETVFFKTFHDLNGETVEVKRAVLKELSPGPKVNHGLSRVSSFVNTYNCNSPVHGSNFNVVLLFTYRIFPCKVCSRVVLASKTRYEYFPNRSLSTLYVALVH
ncbi:hypothetical protein ACP275_01G033800 [Erythranthe tilingii]